MTNYVPTLEELKEKSKNKAPLFAEVPENREGIGCRRVGKIDISRGGNGKCLLGDVDGDGRMELVVVQGNGHIDDRYVPHQIAHISVFSLTGEVLWERGKLDDEPGNFGSDFPAQICDVDGDGKLEVLAVMEKRFLILDGSTGEVKASWELPHENAHDCIILAKLTKEAVGNNSYDIILKDRYRHMWALDRFGTLLWEHEGNLGHFPYPRDINGDGLDEIMAGYDSLDSKGHILWSCKDLDDHADCIWVCDINGDQKLEIAVGGSATVLMNPTTGEEIWRHTDSVESQHIAFGKYVEGSDAIYMSGLDRIRRGDGYKGEWDGEDGMFLVDATGKTVWKEKRKSKGWLTIIDTFSNWNGDGKDYILAYRRGGGELPGLYRFHEDVCEKKIEFPFDGYVIHGDLLGRGGEDVIVYRGGEAHIFSEENLDLTVASGIQIPQSKRLAHSTLYPGAER